MRLRGPLVEGTFVERPNRFLVRAQVGDRVVDAFCPNPGRLGEFLDPGRGVLLVPNAASATRRTAWDHVAFRRADRWFVIDTRVANALFLEGFEQGAFGELAGYDFARPEVRVGKSRFDFLLSAKDGGRPDLLVEVKSVSLFHDENGGFVARFPDAPTLRGARHVRELTDLHREGRATAVCFITAAQGAQRIEPFRERDPAFADALREAADAGVRILARESRLEGDAITLGPVVPVRV